MKRKLKRILLIDDEVADNYYHQMIIEEAKITQKIVAVQNGLEALEYLLLKENGHCPQPELIFLDINMPKMNGWEFLEEYRKLHKSQKGDTVIIMTTSMSPFDREKAQNAPEVKEFLEKPLTIELLDEILQKYFADWL